VGSHSWRGNDTHALATTLETGIATSHGLDVDDSDRIVVWISSDCGTVAVRKRVGTYLSYVARDGRS